jgi:hypothetical protein
MIAIDTQVDPVLYLFFTLGVTGGFGVLVLITITSFAVVAFFAREPSGENAWRRSIAPILASILLVVTVFFGVMNFDFLLGLPEFGHTTGVAMASAGHLRRALPVGHVVGAVPAAVPAGGLRHDRPRRERRDGRVGARHGRRHRPGASGSVARGRQVAATS